MTSPSGTATHLQHQCHPIEINISRKHKLSIFVLGFVIPSFSRVEEEQRQPSTTTREIVPQRKTEKQKGVEDRKQIGKQALALKGGQEDLQTKAVLEKSQSAVG